MYKGGATYTLRAAKVIRYAGLLVPIMLVIYGIGIEYGIIESPQYFGFLSFSLLSFWWLFLSVVQFLMPSKTRRDSMMRLIAYHLLAGAYLLFVSGVSTPFVSFWIILLLASNTYFSKNGLNYSILFFVIIVSRDMLFWTNRSMAMVAFDAITLVAIVLSGLVIMSISSSQVIDRKKLFKSKEKETLQRDRTQTIVNNLADAILSTDKDGIVNVYNASSLNLLDTNDSLNGKHIDDILKLVDQTDIPIKFSKELMKAKTAVTRDDLNFTYDDGEEIRLELTYSPIRSSYSNLKKNESHDGYIIIMRDVTKAKSLEEERDEFISVVSHELRTPITIVEGTISNLQLMMKHPDVSETMMTDAVTMAHDQIIYLARMVNDLSTLSRAERGVADKPEDIDVRAMIHKLHDEYSKEATLKHLHLNLDLGATLGHVSTSRLYLEEMLQNFITNAIKYTKKGTITVTIKQKLGVIKFSVKDTGIGISKSDQVKVFQKFYRSEDYRTRETSGTGLGLYVAAKLSHKVGAKIELTSRLNYGSTFSFTLPASDKK
jgi:PAS domain S-box-containing protein